jgi:excisionase family DNA binding protein
MDSIFLDLLKKHSQQLKNIENALSATKTVMNLNEASLFTHISKSHIYKLTYSGKIPHYKQGKHLYFDRFELEAWLKANRIKTLDAVDKEASTYVTLNRTRK